MVESQRHPCSGVPSLHRSAPQRGASLCPRPRKKPCRAACGGAAPGNPSRGPRRWLVPILFLLIGFSSFARAAEEPVVRVAILQDVEGARVTILTPCRIRDLSTGKLLQEAKDLKWKLVEPADSQAIRVGGDLLKTPAILLEPEGEAVVRVNAKAYQGSLIVQRTAAGRLTIINRLGLEEYLVSALASEVDSRWPIEALKAHAVVSRTMVAHRIWIRQNQPFDVTADTQTHLYYGVSAERKGAREAVAATRGQVLAYNGELFAATFHANCGGHTEDAAEIWDVKGDLAPLTGRPDTYCENLKHYRWEAVLTLKELREILTAAGKGVGDLTACEVTQRNRSGRVRGVRLQGSGGEVMLSGKDFRKILGANRLRSLKFSVEVAGDAVHFNGFGWGHGVGLCQWGAYGMSRQGHTLDEILAFYFPGTQRRNLKGLPGFS